MDVVISTDRIEFSTRTFAYGVQGTEIVKVSYARVQLSTPNWYEVYVDRKNGERIVIDLRTAVPSFPAWTNDQAGAEQAVIDITAVAGVCCDGGGGGVGIVELTGDVLAGPGTGTVPAVLATIGAFAGSYTDPILTVDNKGRVTAITSGPGDDHLVLASVTDTTPGTLIDKIEIVNATAAIINGGADEILRFTPSGGGGGTGAFPIALYRDAGVNTLPMDGSWLDIVLSVALQTAADIVRTGAEFEFQSDGTYFVGFKMTADTGASRAQHKVRLVVDAGGGYAEVDSSIGYTFTPNTSDDLQMAYTGLIPIVAVAGDKIKAQGAASSGTVDIDTLGAGTAIVIFRMQTDAGATEFTQLTDVPNSYVGQALLSVRVNAAETGLEFFAGGGGSGITELTGDVAAGPGSGSQAATIQPGVVDNTKLDNMASQTFKGRNTAGPGDPEDLDADDASDILDGAADPFVRTSNLPADTGITELTGDVTAGPGSGSQVATIAADSVTNAKLDNVPAATFKGSPVGAGTVNPIDLTADQASTILDGATDPFARTSSLPTRAFTTSDFGTTSTSYVSVTGALIPVAANSEYYIKVIGKWTSNNNSGQATFGFTIPSGASASLIRMMGITSSAVTVNMQNTADQSSLVPIGTASAVRPFSMEVRVTTAGTAGNFQLRLASNNASYTATCFAGTLLKAESY